MSERHRLHPVILCGGSGTRLWPLSRMGFPKQFLVLTSQQSLLQQTLSRVAGDRYAPPIVVGAEEHRFMIADHLQQIRLATQRIILEPAPRSTAAATALAAFHLTKVSKDAMMLVLPADHVILDGDCFRRALRQAGELAQQGYMVTLGIEPTFAHTGYGYIKRSHPLAAVDSVELPCYAVERFLEKPNRTLAESFLAEGGYYWNGGIFVSRVDRWLAELRRQTPDIYDKLQHIAAAFDTPQAAETLEAQWAEMPGISIDYAVMEHAEQVAVVPLQAGWNDVGSWDALETILEQDGFGNSIAKGDVLLLDSNGNIVYSDKRLVALVNVSNLVVVDTGDTLLIGDKGNMQRVKDVVEQLRRQGRTELL